MPPPKQSPIVLTRTKAAYKLWLVIFNDFPKVSRNTLGKKIDNYFFDLLETIFAAIYLSGEPKINKLTLASAELDGLKFFLQLAWENKCISLERFSALSEELNTTGRMLGGWRKDIISKTPANSGRNS